MQILCKQQSFEESTAKQALYLEMYDLYPNLVSFLLALNGGFFPQVTDKCLMKAKDILSVNVNV